MRVLRFLHAKRIVLCLGLLALMALASGCSDSNPVTSISPEEGKEKGLALQKAREEAYGKGGQPKSQKTARKQ